MSRTVCGICWCPYDDDTGACGCEPAPKEPVGWMWLNTAHFRKKLPAKVNKAEWSPLYTAPPERKPLTEEEIVEAVREADLDWQAGWTLDEHEPNRFTTLARAIERAHGIGGNA